MIYIEQRPLRRGFIDVIDKEIANPCYLVSASKHRWKCYKGELQIPIIWFRPRGIGANPEKRKIGDTN